MTQPPLPDPDYWSTRDDDTPLFTAAQMESYARAAIAAHVPEADCGNIAAVPAQPLTDEQIHESLCEACSDGSGPVSLAELRQDEAFADMVAFTRALERRIAAAPQAVPVPAVPVASVTECEACFTPDACQLRGKCDHYAAEQLRAAKRPDPLVQWGDWTLVPLNATEPMQKAMQVAVLLRKSMNEVWRAAMSEAPEKKP